MPFELHSYIVDPGDGTIKMEHVFFGLTRQEAETYRDEHLSHCKYMQGADKGEGQGEIIEELVEVDELPSPEDFEDDESEEGEETEESEQPEGGG